ncbi:MAG: hypothetical protein JKY34_12705 [Kordiimonadaceae bacterium]|nr:hypothetical protein [Kordiimonadaceae bacterium]
MSNGMDFVLLQESSTPGTFEPVAGFRANTMSIDGDLVDVTDKDSNGYVEYLEGGGLRSITAGGSGVLENTASQIDLVTRKINATKHKYQLTCAWGTIEGDFMIETLSGSGDVGASQDFDVAVKSTGVFTFTAAS